MRITIEGEKRNEIQDGRLVPVEVPLQVVDSVEAYQLTALRQEADGKAKYHHASILSIQDHIRAEILSMDTLKVKSAQAMGTADNPHYQKFYKLLADWALAQQRTLEAMNIEMNRIAYKEAEGVNPPEPSQN